MKVFSTECRCRICTNTGHNFQSIFNGNERLQRMTKCLPIQIRENDNLPQSICPSCIEALDVTYNFNMLCLKSHLEFLVEKTNRPVPHYRDPPKLEKSSPTSFTTSYDLEQEITTSSIKENTQNSKQNTGPKWPSILQKIPQVRLSRLSELFPPIPELKDNSPKEDLSPPNEHEPIEPPKRKRGRPRKIRPEVRAPSPGTSRCLPKEEQLRSYQSTPGKQESQNPDRQFTKPLHLECSECKNMFLFSALRPENPKHLDEGVVLICTDCKKDREQKIPSAPEEPEVKRPRHSDDNEDVKVFHHLGDHDYALKPRRCKSQNLQQYIKEELLDTEEIMAETKAKTMSQNEDHRCQYCDRLFKRKDSMRLHIMHNHTSPENWKFVCTVCDARYPVESKLTNHNCKGVKRPFKCPLCIRSFERNCHFVLHFKAKHAQHVKKEC